MMSENPDDLKSQLIELQTQLAFQEDTIAALDAVVTGQQREIERLTLICNRLASQLDQLAASWAEQQEPELPPHY
jgi:SlyX protein